MGFVEVKDVSFVSVGFKELMLDKHIQLQNGFTSLMEDLPLG